MKPIYGVIIKFILLNWFDIKYLTILIENKNFFIFCFF